MPSFFYRLCHRRFNGDPEPRVRKSPVSLWIVAAATMTRWGVLMAFVNMPPTPIAALLGLPTRERQVCLVLHLHCHPRDRRGSMLPLQIKVLGLWDAPSVPNKFSLLFTKRTWFPACAGMTSRERRGMAPVFQTSSRTSCPGTLIPSIRTDHSEMPRLSQPHHRSCRT